MVAERTRELDAQKRFVEVVLETLPLGVFVLDAELCVVRANREGARALGCDPGKRAPLAALFGPGKTRVVEAFLREAFETRRGGAVEAGNPPAGGAKNFPPAGAPPRGPGGGLTPPGVPPGGRHPPQPPRASSVAPPAR